MALLLQAAFPPGVQGDPGRGVVRVPLGLPVQRFLVNGAVACGAGGVRGVLEREATPGTGEKADPETVTLSQPSHGLSRPNRTSMT